MTEKNRILRFEWDNSLPIGISVIDDQHRRFIEQANALAAAIERMNQETIGNTIQYLTGFAINHFAAEELFMIRTRYPGFKEHRDEHSRIVKNVFDVYDRLWTRPMTREEANELLDAIDWWIQHHIREVDRGVGEHVRATSAERTRTDQP